jgi:hypothetical protein
MTKQKEIARFNQLASETDSYLALLLSGFEDRFNAMVRDDEVYSIKDMIDFRNKRISNLENELKGERLANAEIKESIKKYLQLILNAEHNTIAIKCFVSDINKLLDEL